MAGNAARQHAYTEYEERNPRAASNARDKVIAVGTMDYTIYLVVVILTVIGVVMVFSSSYLTASSRELYNHDPLYFLKKGGLWALMGFVAMNFMANVNYRYLRRGAFLLYAGTLVLLALVIVLGVSSHGATRWIPFPVINQFQPSELAKAALVIMLAQIVARNNDILKKWSGFLFCMGVVGLMVAMVAYGGMSSAIIVAVIGFGMIFVASPHIMRFVVAGVSGAGAVAAYLFWAYAYSGGENFRGGRVAAWINPWSDPQLYGYQPIQSMYAIASGGLFGLGIGQSRQKTFLPEAHNDIIFSIICEELGFIGAAIVLLLFGILIWRGIRAALNAPDTFGALTAIGIVLTIASQVIINVAVVTNSIPNTGVTMPFISYGGTSLLVCMGLMGILLNISRCSREK